MSNTISSPSASSDNISNKSIVIATHSLLEGAAHALRDYLIDHKSTVYFIELPLIDQRQAQMSVYSDNTQKTIRKVFRPNRGIIDYGIDFFESLFWTARIREKIYLHIGVDPMNCLVGLILRTFGKAKKVYFYSIDFVPIRFENRILNSFFHLVEGYCVRHADEVWNVSPRIAEGREKFLHISHKKYPQKVVPIGVWKISDESRRFNKYQIIFVGHLLEKQGVQEVIRALPLIIKKIPQAKLLIVGGGEYEDTLKKFVSELHLEKSVEFKGWIRKHDHVEKLMKESACAVACYKPERDRLRNFTYYADPTKLKDYFACRLPVILTDVSYNAREIERKKCGIIVSYDNVSIAHAIISLLADEKKIYQYKKNALEYVKQFKWEAIFKNVLS